MTFAKIVDVFEMMLHAHDDAAIAEIQLLVDVTRTTYCSMQPRRAVLLFWYARVNFSALNLLFCGL